jgi:hypothetical protein
MDRRVVQKTLDKAGDGTIVSRKNYSDGDGVRQNRLQKLMTPALEPRAGVF